MGRLCLRRVSSEYVRARLQPCRKEGDANRALAPEDNARFTALRMVRPPESIRVDLQGERPARVYLRGMRGKVLTASGPWRTSGDWWQETPWHQDEWDLEVEVASSLVVAQHAAPASRRRLNDPHKEDSERRQSGSQRALCRVFFDAPSQSWFLRGIYD